MSQNTSSTESEYIVDDRKRKVNVSHVVQDSKKPKLNASLGLSLLQAYDEEEQYSDDETKSNTDVTTSRKECIQTEDTLRDQVSRDNASSCLMKEEIQELSSSSIEIENKTTNDLNTAECGVEISTNLENETEITSDRLDETESKEQGELQGGVDYLMTTSSKLSVNLNDTCLSEELKNSSKTSRTDFDFPVFGKDENFSDSNDYDSKPAKKVKLNRSKFVRPTDESSNETKISTKNTSSAVDRNVPTVTNNERKLPEPDAENKCSNEIAENRLMNVMESTEQGMEVNIDLKSVDETGKHSLKEEVIVENEKCFAHPTHSSDEDGKTLKSIELEDNLQSSIAQEDSLDPELIYASHEQTNEGDDMEEPLETIKSELVPLDQYIGTNLTEERNFNDKQLGNTFPDESVNVVVTEDDCLHRDDNAIETLENDVNENVKISAQKLEDEIPSVSSSNVMEQPDEDLQNSTHEEHQIKGGDEALKDIVIVDENKSEKQFASEEVKKPTKCNSKLDLLTSDEEVFEDAMDTIEASHSRTTEKAAEDAVTSKSAEISKLERALTGRLENFTPHVKKVDNHNMVRKETPEKESKPAAEDAKQNIKLHLSVQGDRVSIRNAQTVSEGSSLPPVRVKRQYRKRQKIPGELEAKQASAKEYTNRLRQRAERETPGAKKRGRKKKNQDPDATETTLDSELSSSPADLSVNVASPLTVAINKSTRKSSVSGKVQPIKLKISKNANVTIECTSKYDVCSASDEIARDPVNVNEKIVGILEEARKKEGPSPNHAENAPVAWSGTDLQRVERLLKESNITITPVAAGRDDTPQPVSVLEPILNSKEKLDLPTPLKEESEIIASITPMDEDVDVSKNIHIPLKEDNDRPNSWKMVTPSENETNFHSIPGSLSASKSVDVKSEIRKKIASVEKRKQDINMSEIDSINVLQLQKAQAQVANLFSPLTDVPMIENAGSENLMLSTRVDPESDKHLTPNPSPTSIPIVHKTPPAKLPHLPVELFPKKRGRPTKAMVAAREAYRQQQEELDKIKKEQMLASGEIDSLDDFNLTSTSSMEPVKIVKRGRKPKHDRLEKKDSDDLSYDELPFDPAREAEEQKRLEEERMKKEEERERKNEMRRIKAKERSDLVKAKRLRQKMKAKERHKLAKELRRLQQEEKKKLEEQLKSLPASMGFDDDTRMSAENSQATNMSFSIGMVDDDSSGAANDLSQKLKKSRVEIADSDSKDLMVDQVAEYQWPIQGGDLYMIQEQVSNFLGVKSFKRKYPDIWRRPVDSEERAYLVDSGLVSETLCDLGITAVRSAEVLDIMCSDFSEKYEEFRRYMREKQMKELSFKQRAWANGLGYKLLMADGSKQDMKKRAMESVSNWNSALNKSRIEDRRTHMDLQTFIIHHPKHRGARMTGPSPKIGSYPISILPGQFCDYYKEYTPTELRYMPVNTVLYGPLKNHTALPNGDASQTDSDDSSSSDDSSTTSEDTQATEETLEDIDKDICMDGSTLRFGDKDSSFVGDEEQVQREINSDCNPPPDSENLKILCKVCLGDQFRNKLNVPEVLICCSQCASMNHPTCLDLSLNSVPRIKSYAWQCPECKICFQCKENADEDKMLFCDTCDRGYHIYCVGLIKVPAGTWQCKECTILMTENKINVAEVSLPKEPHSHTTEMSS